VGVEIRDLTPDDFDDVLDLRWRSFGPLSPADQATWRRVFAPVAVEGRYLGAFDGGRLMAAARLRPFTQWWHGRPQSMAGVAGVTVNPEDRGRGVAKRLMAAVLGRAAELGDAVSALYPATSPLYRAVGYEHAGAQNVVGIPAERLRTLRPGTPVELRRMGPDDAPELLKVVARAHARTRASGPITWDERAWRLLLAQADDFRYIADDGYAVYRWNGGDIEVDSVVAASEATSRALWALIGSASSVAQTVIAAVAPDDPVLWSLGERTKETVKQVRWMLRVVDLPAAIERRGYPAGVRAEVLLEVEDPTLPANSGTWRLTVADGAGGAEAADGTGARVGAGGLAALYAGVPTATLRLSGLLTGPDASDAALDAIFSARPYMLQYF
jgi:predicted acetyltransferase